MTKKEAAALTEELKKTRERAREIAGLLRGPAPDNEAIAYLRAADGPRKGKDIADALGKTHASTVRLLSAAVAAGKAIRVGVGEYQAVSP